MARNGNAKDRRRQKQKSTQKRKTPQKNAHGITHQEGMALSSFHRRAIWSVGGSGMFLFFLPSEFGLRCLPVPGDANGALPGFPARK